MGRTERRTTGLTAAAVAAATALVLLLGVWAASGGPDDPFRGDGPGAERTSVSTAPVTAPPPRPTSQQDVDDEPVGSSWVTLVVAVLLGLFGLFLIGCVVAMVLALWPDKEGRRRELAEREALAPGDPVDDPVDAVATAMLSDADDQERLLLDGTPRNGVVACWHRFEVQAAGAGIPRHGWETSSEFTLRLLDLVEADASAVAELATLFREARFSTHELGEADRAVALDALRRIHTDLRTLLSRGVR